MHTDVLKTTPAVFAVENTYQIFIPVKRETLMWVKVGDRIFYDHRNGTMRSDTDIHKVTVLQEYLDKERAYTVCYRIVKERKPYFTETEDVREITYPFYPVTGCKAKAFLIADAHNDSIATVGAVQKFEEKYGAIDFLILAGDIPDHSGDVENFMTIYEIAANTVGGTKPIVYAKGNHDLRGICAERMEDYTPNANGCSYFTFRIGDIWGISLDCGEDKEDWHAEYGHTVCCHPFRLEQTDFIRRVIRNAKSEYDANGVRHKIVVVHNPFSELQEPPFDIEKEIYSEWCRLLKQNIKPDLMICGHMHELAVNEVGSAKDHLGQPCRVVVGTKPYSDENNNRHFIGTGFFFHKDGIAFVFIDDSGKEYTVAGEKLPV